jgi:serine/threonine protein kinase
METLKGYEVFPSGMSQRLYLAHPKANILINKDRRACLADFGLSTVTGVATHATAGASRTSLISNETLMSFTSGGTRRWMSPELLDPERFGVPQSEGDRPTRQSDCYALGMVIYEVRVRVSLLLVADG